MAYCHCSGHEGIRVSCHEGSGKINHVIRTRHNKLRSFWVSRKFPWFIGHRQLTTVLCVFFHIREALVPTWNAVRGS